MSKLIGMNSIGNEIYRTLVKHAERGGRITRVTLPPDLFVEYLAEQGMTHMMRTLKVEVVSGKVEVPMFETGEAA